MSSQSLLDFRNILLTPIVLGTLAICSGCQTEQPVTNKQNAESQTPAPDDAEDSDNAGKSMMGRASDLMNGAKDAGTESLNWVKDKAGNVVDSSSQIAGDSATWVNDTFNSLKDQGLTTASNATEWLTDDYNNMGAWQYNVLKVTPEELENVEAKLDELGKAHWECFHIAEVGSNQFFYFKKSRRSYIRSLPMRDVLKLIPLMGGGGR